MRISVMPASRGQKIVIRIIDPGNALRPLKQVFLTPAILDAVNNVISGPYGAVVVAGPTGSGKSSSLYAMLTERHRSRSDSSIVTVEDPVEYELEQITQVPVTPQLGFAAILRGLLRQDPDVMMIGELRDAETALIMTEAALTGHLVFTSTHGSDVMAVIQRLYHFGIDHVLVSQALSLIIVQRLARRLCPTCCQVSPVGTNLLESLSARGIKLPPGTTELPRPVGCESCGRSGYMGRVAVQEMLQLDDVLRTALAADATPTDLLKKARQRRRYVSFAESTTFLMQQRILSPSDALLALTSA
jgi:type IV pilus assembly protein PilB